ncbi:MAG: 23S rRNA (uracil(1939)-C(5))-methyltransferase RlmD [Bacteroidales bacterium]|nr:23S rRNA (uracil(1939)-C(5))-methyltransferase RlmD [Bacteroidales bacterium]
MKDKTLPFYEKVEISDAGSEGKSVARVDGKVIFVQFGVPGDVVDVQIVKKKRRYEEGTITRFYTYSDKRVEPTCGQFGLCGGCKWQNMSYQDQLFYKQKQVVDNLTRIGHLELPEISPILASEKTLEYRNKLEFTFCNRRWFTKDEPMLEENDRDARGLGFHLPTMWDRVLDIKHCYLQPEPTNAIRLALKQFCLDLGCSFYDQRAKKGYMRNIVVRNSVHGDLMVLVVFNWEDLEKQEKILDFLLERFPQIKALLYTINDKLNDAYNDLPFTAYKTQDYILEEMDGLHFRVGAQSFYQTNHEQALKLYQVARDFASLTGREMVYDLYTGTGTIAAFVARNARKVVGIEYVEEAINDAKQNSEINHITNTEFFAGNMAKVFTEDFIAKYDRPDVIITDPPRNGMEEKVIIQILKAAPQRIVYVSCNPATQARDLALMNADYKITKIQPVDMFPHTHHVENVVLLERR